MHIFQLQRTLLLGWHRPCARQDWPGRHLLAQVRSEPTSHHAGRQATQCVPVVHGLHQNFHSDRAKSINVVYYHSTKSVFLWVDAVFAGHCPALLT